MPVQPWLTQLLKQPRYSREDMEREPGNTHGQAAREDNSLKFCDQEIDLPATTSDSRRYTQTNCPVHNQQFPEPPRRKIPPGVHPSQRLEYTPSCDLPVGMSGGCRVGTSASAGCICTYDPDILNDEMTREVEVIIQEAKQEGGKQEEKKST
ncbi:hypothetical protein COCSADRAFT_356600 [Bipolaris sorokiniana ND90Pr]|uniref:Uncharacterized protein n=1 Tax=Cochliobolus sativus (strain ND90Pr / ATCC 201652) TaxID=665912 RepID=M2T7M4_COCSN|nr:uncharacterized protein COCSADRAFT_356600 [Bipolaris sorokiniana ND90Pr]EMD65226.1 hypothetical protein COCSADRAFT_356600 [Bipolaris sorokiniana ND90Pr]